MKYTFLAFLMVFSSWVQSAIKPADGLWRSTDDPDIGSGMMMITQGGITLVSVFTYTDAGSPRWYLAVGSVDENGLLVARLQETTNGTSILVDNPASAEYSAIDRELRIEFSGSQTASFSIDGQTVKTMQSYNFSFPSWQTEHQTLTDGTEYSVADLSGLWVVGGVDTDESFALSFTEIDGGSNNSAPFLNKQYTSPNSTEGWLLECPYQFLPTTLPFSQPYCTLDRSSSNLPTLRVPYPDLGVSQMTLVSEDGSETYKAFRVAPDKRILPHDGYWQPEDDAEIGGGLVLTTQGPYTVVLMYSYDENGDAAWSIAAGAFDENGLLQTDLLSTSGGSPIEVDGKTSATYTNDVQSLEIQLLGAELAAFSVDGAPAKHIQNVNFGAQLFSTEQVKVNDKAFKFPAQNGRWLAKLNFDDLFEIDVIDLNSYSPNCCISPIVPILVGAVGYRSFDINSSDLYALEFLCIALTSAVGQPELLQPYCEGILYFGGSDASVSKLYFEDIGVNAFRYYYGLLGTTFEDINSVDRNSEFIEFYRLD